jgi:3-phosphoshikimate 1-carboxyvinyltransferase
MEKIIVPSFLKGEVTAPPSKSMTQRAIAAALLSDTESTILNPSGCEDSKAALGIAASMGAEIQTGLKKLKMKGGGRIKEKKLYCGESGLAIRMFSPIAALYPYTITMTGSGSLRKRPMSMIEDALSQLGVTCKSEGGYIPLTVKGPLRGGKCEVDGSISSQLLTGLLMALPLAAEDSEIYVKDLKSKPYIDMTLQVLDKFGIKIQNTNYTLFNIKGAQKYQGVTFEVESDWSGGAFLLIAGAVNGEITVNGLRPDSRQSDKAILGVLDSAGARMSIKENSVKIAKSELKSFKFDSTESPDLFPPLVVLAAYCDGISVIKGVSRLIHKESDRAAVLREEFAKMNIGIEVKGDTMLVTGGEVQGALIDSHNDHRIAMAAAVAALRASNRISIKDAFCVAKSYPEFFQDLRNLGAWIC